MNQKPLNKKEVKKIIELIKKQWDADVKLDYAFFLSNKDKVYIINKEVGNFDLSGLRINSIGLYFGEYAHNCLRLSIEGSQIIGGYAMKNVVELNDETARKWLSGEDVEIDKGECKGFVIIKNNEDYLGCGKVVPVHQKIYWKILNYVPKNRRVKGVN